MVSAMWPPIPSTVVGSIFGTPLTAEPMAAKLCIMVAHPRKSVHEHEVDEARAKQVSECAAEITGSIALVHHVLDGRDKDLNEQEAKEKP